MKPDRWNQITDIFHAALARDDSSRNTFLDQACRGDPALRDEVERLLASHRDAGTFGDVAMSATAVHLKPGASFGPYIVGELLGAGGMGEVYRARDPKLSRDVAIKVLPAAVTSDPDRLSRFTREARLLASLNHPNVGAIYEVEDEGAARGLVLELIEGPTLADRIAAGPVPVREALGIARQVAAALEAAHGKGIVHRDLKPANIKLTPAGVVKVIDFGIAKLSTGEANRTLTATSAGLVIGTAAYMSPEQARGETVDKRTDIWAFGCVLYEMLTGRQPFDARTASDMVARILEHEPAWDRVPATVPLPIRKLLRRCLAKDPADRLHDIADARPELTDVLSSQGSSPEPHAPSRPQRRWLWALAGGVATALALGGWSLFRTSATPPAAAPVEFGIRFPDNHSPAHGVALSPNGRYLATGVFGNRAELWLHSFDSGQTRPLPATEGAFFPFWSPDSARIAFFARGKLYTIDPGSGATSVLCDLPLSAQIARGGTWSTSGRIVFAIDRQLFSVPATGGEPKPVPIAGSHEPSFPQFLPDGRHLLFFDGSQWGNGTMQLVPADGGELTALVKSDAPGTFAPPGYLLFLRGASLMSQPFNPQRLVIEGTPTLVRPDVSFGVLYGFRAMVSASSTGELAFAASRGGSVGQLTWFERTGQAIGSLPAPPDGEYLNPALSPSGDRVAVNLMDPQSGDWDIWLIDLARGVPLRFTSTPARESDPVWSPDGKEIVFASDRDGTPSLYRKSVDGSVPERVIAKIEDARDVVPTDWSPDGKYLLFSRWGFRFWSTWMIPLHDGGKPVELLDDQFSPYASRLSPDGHWLAYGSFESGAYEVFVQRFPTADQKTRISNGGGTHPRWTADGHELVYWAVPRGIDAVSFESSGSTLRVGPRRSLVSLPVLSLIDARTHFDITRDGKRLLVRQPAGPQQAGLTVILNWTSKLK